MANINYRIKEINQKVSKDYAIQFDIGKQLKENLKIYNVYKSKSRDFFSNYEEEEETKNDKYYQEFLSQLFSDSERKKKSSKSKNIKVNNSPMSNNKKISSPNSLKVQSSLRERNNSKKSSGIKSIGNVSPSNKSDKQVWLKRYYRNSCMIPIVENKLNQDDKNESNIVGNENITKENNNNFVIQRIQNINQEEKKTFSNCIKTITFCKTTSNVNKDNNGTSNKVKKNQIVLCCIPFKCL